MPELTILEGQGAGLRVPLSADQAYTIGGGRDDSIQVADVASGYLIVKALKSGGFGMKGLAGPFRHNDADVEVARLSNGDRIALGSVVLEYRDQRSAAEPEPIPVRASKSRKNKARTADAGSAAPGVGDTLGGFRLIDVLGRGGMGVVYRAEQVSLSREVALKVLSDKLTADPVFVEQFVAEARAAARLHHPNVVQVFDVDQLNGTSFYSMELMHKGSVEDELKRSGRLSIEHALSIITDAARGLGFAESLRIVHRDIKPDNLMVDQHDHIKIADLGLAMSDADEQGGRVLGTPHFMSPEQIQRLPLDHRSDLYALGCTFFRLVTGETPFKGTNVKEIVRAQVKTPAPLAHEVASDVPSDVSAIIAKLLEKVPDARFQSADELLGALGQLQAPPSRKGLLVGGLAAAALIAGGAVWWAATLPDPKTETVTIEVTDPDAVAAAARSDALAAERTAESAYLRVLADGLDGLAKANALDEVASEHADTEFGTKAKDEAQRLRAAVERADQAEVQRLAAVVGASDAVRSQFDAAIAADDFRAADIVLSMDAVPEALRDDPDIRALHDTLAASLTTAGQSALRKMKAAVDTAVNSRDAKQIESALAPLTAALTGPSAWPAAALGDRGPLERFVADARVTVESIRSATHDATETASWAAIRNLLVGTPDLAGTIRALDLAGAAQRANAFADNAGVTSAATHVRKLGSALTAAAAYLESFSSAAQAGTITIGDGDDAVRSVRFERSGATAGLVVKTGGRRPSESVLSLEQMRAQPMLHFPVLGDSTPKTTAGRTALLGSVMLAEQIDRVQRYLGTVQASADSSGVGNYETAPSALYSADLSSALSGAPEEWRDALIAEIDAARTIDRALRAFSEQRNLAAARLLDRALKAARNTSIVQCLQ